VPPASFGKTEAGDKYGHPAQGVDPVDMIAGLHPAEAEAAPGADAAGPGLRIIISAPISSRQAAKAE